MEENVVSLLFGDVIPYHSLLLPSICPYGKLLSKLHIW